MYEPDTILTLKEPRDPQDPERPEEPFPYNRVRVVGQSPINHGVYSSEWTGAAGTGVILTPLTGFAGVIDEPLGKVQALYNIESVPEREVEVNTRVRVINSASAQAGPTPEEVFAVKAPGVAPEEGQTRGRTPMGESPLGEDPRPAAGGSPLDAKPKKAAR